MISEDVLDGVSRAFVTVFGTTAKFTPSLERSTEPRWTSLKHVEFIIALEREFGLRFDGADATDMISIPLVAERVRQGLRR